MKPTSSLIITQLFISNEIFKQLVTPTHYVRNTITQNIYYNAFVAHYILMINLFQFAIIQFEYELVFLSKKKKKDLLLNSYYIIYLSR